MNGSFYICALFLCLFHISTCQNILFWYNAPEKNIDYPGNDVANKIVNNASACAAECDKCRRLSDKSDTDESKEINEANDTGVNTEEIGKLIKLLKEKLG